MLFVARDLVAGAHEAPCFAAALADPHAAQGRAPKASFVLRKLEVCLHRRRLISQAVAKIVQDGPWLDEFPGVHAVSGVPGFLKLTESLHQLRPEHARQKFSPSLAVAMLTGDGSTVPNHE